MEVHIEITGNKTGIQFRPGNPYLLTASTTSLTGEIHNESAEDVTPNLVWMAFDSSEVHGE